MREVELVIVGAGPAGLCAAIEAAEHGTEVLLIDENALPGGQLFKQIHKFFGSHEHRAGVRGIQIGRELLERAEKLNIEAWLSAEVLGIEPGNKIWGVRDKKHPFHVHGRKVIIAAGATENAVTFPGWELPGVMGAGAAQTMVNVNRVLPGKRFVILGSGNVGVIVSYQLLQAGADVAAIVEAAPKLGGYGVHTAKVARQGVPFYVSHTIKRAIGKDHVEAVELIALDEKFRKIPGTEERIDCDTVCLATGLSPLTELAWIAGVEFCFNRPMGGHIPVHNEKMQTSNPDIFVAGDVSGIEEASTAMDEGRLAGINAACTLGHVPEQDAKARTEELWRSLDALRSGVFGERRRTAKQSILDASKQREAQQ